MLWAGMLAALACWRSELWLLLPPALAVVALALHQLAGRLGPPESPRTAHGRLPPIARPAISPTGAGN